MTRNPHHDDELRFEPLALFGPVAAGDIQQDEEEPGGGGTGGGAGSGND